MKAKIFDFEEEAKKRGLVRTVTLGNMGPTVNVRVKDVPDIIILQETEEGGELIVRQLDYDV